MIKIKSPTRAMRATILFCITICTNNNFAHGTNQISESEINKLLKDFINHSKPNRTVGQPGHTKAFEYIGKQFQKIASTSGGNVYLHKFMPDIEFAHNSYRNDFNNLVEGKIGSTDPEYKKWSAFTETSINFVKQFKGVEGKNLVLELKGHQYPEEILYVGAHFDTITHDHNSMRFTPDSATDGADDNASGITALISIAKHISKNHAKTIRFVAFDYEEIFFLGSYALAKDLRNGKVSWAKPNEKIVGLMNLEMLGWAKTPLKNKPIVKIYTRKNEEKGAGSDLKLAKIFVESTVRHKAKITPKILQNGFNRSDNWSFWQFNFPAICISQDWEQDFNESNYHTNHDSEDKLNIPYLTEITNVALEAVKTMAK